MPLLIILGIVAAIVLLTENASADTSSQDVLSISGDDSTPIGSIVDVHGFSSTPFFGVPDVASTSGGILNTTRLVDFANAVIPTEGKPGDLNYRNNNPGNLEFAGQPGATADAKGFAVFPTLEAGQKALQNQLAKNARDYPQFTLLQWAKHYLGMDPNSPIAVTGEGNALTKAQSIAQSLGVSVNTTLAELLGGKG